MLKAFTNEIHRKKRLFHIIYPSPSHPLPSYFPPPPVAYRSSRSFCYFIFEKICLGKLCVHLCLYKIQNTTSFKYKQESTAKKIGCMLLKRCVRKGEAEYSTLSCCFFFYLLSVIFAFSVNVYNLKAHTSFNASREFFCGPGRAGEWRWYTYNQIAEQQTNDGWRKTLSSILFCQKKCGRKRGNTHSHHICIRANYQMLMETPSRQGKLQENVDHTIFSTCMNTEQWMCSLCCRVGVHCTMYIVHVVGIFILPMWAMTCIVYTHSSPRHPSAAIANSVRAKMYMHEMRIALMLWNVDSTNLISNIHTCI